MWRFSEFRAMLCLSLHTGRMLAIRPIRSRKHSAKFYFYFVGHVLLIRHQDSGRPSPKSYSLFLLVLLIPFVGLAPCLSSYDPNNPLAPAYILSLTQHENRPGQPPRFEPWSWEAILQNIERERKLSDNSSTSGNNDYRSLGELTMLSRS